MRILLVEDDNTLAKNLKSFLEKNSFVVDLSFTIEEAEEKLSYEEFDLMILDWMLPDGEGIEFLKKLRKEHKSLPVIFLTARTDVKDKIEGFTSGADDYLTKPFSMQELLFRIRALLRRVALKSQSPLIKIADLEINTNTCEVRRGGKVIQLAPREYALLEYLCLNKCQAKTRMEILEHVWGEYMNEFSNTVDVHIRYLRKKIDEGFKKKLIKTVKGKGYMICDS